MSEIYIFVIKEIMRIVATPRDAMQGKKTFIPTKLKAEYINCLLKVGFDTIDFGSFVSPKAIPQLSDTVEVLKMLDYLCFVPKADFGSSLPAGTHSAIHPLTAR